jgi:hypothetical protein
MSKSQKEAKSIRLGHKYITVHFNGLVQKNIEWSLTIVNEFLEA